MYLDLTIDGDAAGRIVIELFPDAPVGALRFAELCEEKGGVGYWRSKFNGIFPTYLRNDGARAH